MRLSTETTSVLKNFSTINQNLVVKAGSNISTMSAMKNIVAKAEVKEDFPSNFAIYDLNEFLSALSLFNNVDLQFDKDFVILSNYGAAPELRSFGPNLKYWFSDPSVVTTPSKEISMPSEELSFKLSSDTLNEITKAAAVIGVPDMALSGGRLMVTDKKNSTANAYETPVDVGDVDAEYKFWFKVDNLKIMPGDYDVEVSSKKISHFTNTKIGVEYWIALEPESTYNA